MTMMKKRLSILAMALAMLAAPPSADADSVSSLADYHSQQWQIYCERFHDMENNNGWSSCPAADGLTPNMDMDIEGLLFADTIHIEDDNVRIAVTALLKHLVNPDIHARLPDSMVTTTTGKEKILRQQHVNAARTIAYDVISSIIGRRMPVTPTADEIAAAWTPLPPPPAVVDPAAGTPVVTIPTQEKFDVAIGDSVANILQRQGEIDGGQCPDNANQSCGFFQCNPGANTDGGTCIGRTADGVLNTITAMPDEAIDGRNVLLSPGLIFQADECSTGQSIVLANQISELKNKGASGAAHIIVLGTYLGNTAGTNPLNLSAISTCIETTVNSIGDPSVQYVGGFADSYDRITPADPKAYLASAQAALSSAVGSTGTTSTEAETVKKCDDGTPQPCAPPPSPQTFTCEPTTTPVTLDPPLSRTACPAGERPVATSVACGPGVTVPCVPGTPPSNQMDAPVSAACGQSLGTLEDAANCPYLAALQAAQPGSFEALIMKIGCAQTDGVYTTRNENNSLGKYLFSELALQQCVADDSNGGANPENLLNNNYGADLNPSTQQKITTMDLEVWRDGMCSIASPDLAATPAEAELRNSEDFLNNPCMQEALIRKTLMENAPTIMAHAGVGELMCTKVIGTYVIEHNKGAPNLGEVQEAGVFVTPSGLLYAAHIFGVDGLLRAIEVYLGGGSPAAALPTYNTTKNARDPDPPAFQSDQINQVAAPGTTLSYPVGTLITDAQDIPWTAYVAQANYFEIKDDTGAPMALPGTWTFDCTGHVLPGEVDEWQNGIFVDTPSPYTPPTYGTAPYAIETSDYPFDEPGDIPTLPAPQKLLKQMVHEIREKAGIRREVMAEYPSYNESMQAFTREKFLDPNYYIDTAKSDSALQQELALTEAYINIQMKDIYDMQERINALLAARAALMINSEPPRPSMIHTIPQQGP